MTGNKMSKKKKILIGAVLFCCVVVLWGVLNKSNTKSHGQEYVINPSTLNTGSGYKPR